MLSNQDLAELLESTRDRVNLMGGDAPSAVGVVGVLNGLITMLRDEVSSDAGDADLGGERVEISKVILHHVP